MRLTSKFQPIKQGWYLAGAVVNTHKIVLRSQLEPIFHCPGGMLGSIFHIGCSCTTLDLL
jgi:hypothetical protein